MSTTNSEDAMRRGVHPQLWNLIRADERERIRQRIEALVKADPGSKGYAVGNETWNDAIFAVLEALGDSDEV